MARRVLAALAVAVLAAGAAGCARAAESGEVAAAGGTASGEVAPMPSRGVIRSWDLEQMQGVIDGDDVPGGCRVPITAVPVERLPALIEGRQVEFEWHRLDRPDPSGFEFECSRAWPAGEQPYVPSPRFRTGVWTIHADGSIEDVTDELPGPVPEIERVTGRTTGTVRTWNDEEGWGVIDSEQTPGGCWAHYSHIVGAGFRTVEVGTTVALDWEQVADQDGYRFRATRVEEHVG